MVAVHKAPIRVLIASRSPAWSAGIAGLLPERLRVEIAATAEDALAGLAAGDHDLVVIDRALARALAAGAGLPEDLAAALQGGDDGCCDTPEPLAEWARRRDAADASLTDQERVVLRLMRQHLTYKEIAQRLGVSWHTVRTHAQSILRKRGVHSRRDLEQEVLVG